MIQPKERPVMTCVTKEGLLDQWNRIRSADRAYAANCLVRGIPLSMAVPPEAFAFMLAFDRASAEVKLALHGTVANDTTSD
jgi:hypothetical protein